jgi:hypothetical protein
MPTHPVYQRLLAEMTDADEAAVLKVLLEHIGQHVTRLDMIEAIQGLEARCYAQKHGLTGNTDDRRNRKAIERLQARDFPIAATSSQSGYVLVADDEVLEASITEIGNRIKTLDAKKEALERSRSLVPLLREYRRSLALRQERLL